MSFRYYGMGIGGQKGKGKPQRDADLDRRFNASTSATSHNVNAFLLRLSFYLRKIIEPWEDYLAYVPCIETFGKFLSWIFRHNPQVLHEDLSLTLNELFWFPQFQQHINNGISYMQQPSYRNEPIFGVIDCQEVRNECKKNNIQFESVQYFVPFVCVTWMNGKGRFSLAIQSEGTARIPAEEDWKTPPMNDALMLDHLRQNGVIRGTNIFFRAQSGHSDIRRTQRPGVEYDFRHNMLMHKTTANKFEDIKSSRALKVMGGRDIHLVPGEFLYHDPDMLRQYGERVILFNLHQEKTRKALSTARETPNGYILLNEDVPIERFEAVYALEKTQWECPFSPTTAPKFNQSHGLDDAQALCSYFSRCYHVKRPVDFEDLDAALKGRVIAIGQHYEQNLRHSGVFGDVPASASAESMKVLLRHRRGQLLRSQWNKKRRRQGKKKLAETLHHHQRNLQFRFRLQHQKENHNNQTIHRHLTDQNNRIIHLQVWRIFQIYQLHQHHLDTKDPDDALMCLVIFTGEWQDPIQRIHEHHCRDTGQINLKKKMKENVTLLTWNITTIPTLMPMWQSWMKLNILCQTHKKPRGKEQSFGTGWRISQSQELLQDLACWIVWSRRVETRLRSPNTHIFHKQSQHRLNILNAKIPAKPVQSFVRTSWWRSKTTNSTGMCSTRWETLVATALRGVLCCQTILETVLRKNTMSTLFTLLWQF